MKKSVKTKKAVKAKKKRAASKRAKPLGKQYYAHSPRLGVRLLEAGDEAMYCDLYTDAKTLEGLFAPLTLEAAKQRFGRALAKTQQQPWTQRISVVVERDTMKPVGIASIKMIDTINRVAETGMLLKASARSQLYATEISPVLTNSIFRRHTVASLTTHLPAGNKMAERWVSKLGYEKTHDIPATDERSARSSWSIHREKWAAMYK